MIEPGQLRRWKSDGLAGVGTPSESLLFMTIRPALMEFSSTVTDEIWWVLSNGGERWFFADDIENESEIVGKE